MIGAVAVAGIAVVWWFSRAVGLDMATGWAVLWRMGLLLATVCACWKLGREIEFFALSQSWPVLVALFWVCWWPALDLWAQQQQPAFWGVDAVVLWWNAWYTKLGGLLAIGGLGYLLKRNLEE